MRLATPIHEDSMTSPRRLKEYPDVSMIQFFGMTPSKNVFGMPMIT